jgi:hypothetical protein
VYARSVDPSALGLSLSSHRHSYIRILLSSRFIFLWLTKSIVQTLACWRCEAEFQKRRAYNRQSLPWVTSSEEDLKSRLNLYKAYIREANDGVKLTTPQRSPRKTQKWSGGSSMLRGVSSLESEVTETADFDAVNDEIRRRWSLSEDDCQRFVNSEDGVLTEIEMMWQLRILFPLHFVLFKQTACRLSAEANVEQVYSRAGQLLDVDPDALADMVSILVTKLAYKHSVKDTMDKYYAIFRGKTSSATTVADYKQHLSREIANLSRKTSSESNSIYCFRTWKTCCFRRTVNVTNRESRSGLHVRRPWLLSLVPVLYKRLPEGIKNQRLSPVFANGYPLRIAQKYKIPPSFTALASKHKSPLQQSATINTKENTRLRWQTHTLAARLPRGEC